MNIEEYISSGILECYVLGQLNRFDAAKVEELAMQHPEIKVELESIEKGLEHYAAAHAIAPPIGLKEKILSDISIRETTIDPLQKVIKLNKPNTFIYYLAAASVTLAFLFGIAALYFYQKWDSTQNQLTALRLDSEKTAYINSVNNKKITQELQSNQNLLSLISDTNSTRVKLKGLPSSPQSLAIVYWNKNAHSVILDVKNLPKPPDNKQYQLWALYDGIPLNAGVFDVDSTGGFKKMKNVLGAQAFAVTLENKGGVAAPTLDQMYMLGNI